MCARSASSSVRPLDIDPPEVVSSSIGARSSGPLLRIHRTLDEVLELAHVARPGVADHGGHHIIGYVRRRSAVAARVLRQKVVEDRWNVVGPFTQRRNNDRKNIESIEQIEAERSILEHLLYILVRRRHDPHVDARRL
jgi:hypothetical protein